MAAVTYTIAALSGSKESTGAGRTNVVRRPFVQPTCQIMTYTFYGASLLRVRVAIGWRMEQASQTDGRHRNCKTRSGKFGRLLGQGPNTLAG